MTKNMASEYFFNQICNYKYCLLFHFFLQCSKINFCSLKQKLFCKLTLAALSIAIPFQWCPLQSMTNLKCAVPVSVTRLGKFLLFGYLILGILKMST
jgi:hypothetical protein